MIFQEYQDILIWLEFFKSMYLCTGKFLSEALILASSNPQYDNRFFIELQTQYKKSTSSVHVVYTNCFLF